MFTFTSEIETFGDKGQYSPFTVRLEMGRALLVMKTFFLVSINIHLVILSIDHMSENKGTFL